jgi:isoquinoline 1-oxidoreductase beta subunit
VFQVPSGVAVGADHFWAAKIARYGLRVDWDLGPAATFSTEKARRELRSLAVRPGLKATAAGEPGAAQLRAARQVVEATYEAVRPFLPHSRMEPLNCTVRLGKDSCEIWTGTRFQTIDQGLGAAGRASCDPGSARWQWNDDIAEGVAAVASRGTVPVALRRRRRLC